MQVNSASKQLLQGSFNLRKKDSDKEGNSNILKKDDGNNYEKTIKGLEEQMKSVSANENYDPDTKKEKIKAIQDQIKEIRKLKQDEELKKLKSEESVQGKDENVYLKNDDGDTVTLSDNMMQIIKDDNKVKKQEEQSLLKSKLEGKANRLESEIEKDRGRNKSMSNGILAEASITEKMPEGISKQDLKRMDYNGFDAKHKGEDVEELKEAIERIENNEVEKLDKSDDDKSKNVSEVETTPEEETVNNQVKPTDEETATVEGNPNVEEGALTAMVGVNTNEL